MLIIDAHEDIAYNALEWGRDIRDSVYTVRAREEQAGCCYSGDDSVGPGGIAMSGLPELRRGGVGIIFGVIFAYPQRAASSPEPAPTPKHIVLQKRRTVSDGSNWPIINNW